jgi:hypothetical protein
MIPFQENDPIADPEKVETTIASSRLFVALLSQDYLKQAPVIFALECACVYSAVRTVLLHGILLKVRDIVGGYSLLPTQSRSRKTHVDNCNLILKVVTFQEPLSNQV